MRRRWGEWHVTSPMVKTSDRPVINTAIVVDPGKSEAQKERRLRLSRKELVDCRDRPRKENAKGTGERCYKEGDPLSVLGTGGQERESQGRDGDCDCDWA